MAHPPDIPDSGAAGGAAGGAATGGGSPGSGSPGSGATGGGPGGAVTARPEVTTSGHHPRVIDEAKIRAMEMTISWVLRIGVVTSVLILAAGLGLMFSRHPQYMALSGSFSYHSLTKVTSRFPHSIGGMSHALAKGEGRGVIVLGLLVLLATPVLRVAVGVINFAYEKDPPMTIVTLYVLLVLVGSFFIGNA